MFKKAIILLLILTYTCSFSIAQSDTTSFPDKEIPEEFREGVWVTFYNDSLFVIRERLGPYGPAERARLIELNLKEIYKDLKVLEDSFRVKRSQKSSVILYKDTPILSLSLNDVKDSQLSIVEAENKIIEIIKKSFESRLVRLSQSNTLKSIGITLVLVAGLALILIIINRVFKFINKRLVKYEQGLKRKRKSLFRYLAPKGPDYFFTFLSKVVKWLVILLVLFLYLPLIFRYNVYTEDLARTFYNYISDPVMYVLSGIYDFIIHNLIFIVLILIIARYITRVMSTISREIEQEKLVFKGFHKDWARPTTNILKVIIYVFAIVFMFPFIPGSDSPAFQGVSIFLGVLLSLGSTSAIANAVAGVVITYMRPFTVGDRVKIGNTIGEVVSKTLLVTKIKTLKNEDVTIPNATIISGQLWNYSTHASEIGIILHTSVTIGYDVPWETVNELLLKAAKNTPNLTREFKPFVMQKGLNDFYVEYELNVYTKQPQKMADFYSELHKNILEAFNEAGVEIMSPHYNAIRDGNASTVPDIPDTRNPVEKIIDKASGKKK